MYAIVNIAGKQMKVSAGESIYVHRLPQDAGESVEFNEVLLVDNDGAVNVGKPHVDGVTVSAKVVDHVKGDKVIVFKKKRRKGYRVKNGHRQALSLIEIKAINA